MRILRLSIFLIGYITALAYAEDVDWQVICQGPSSLCATIMEAHQGGVSMALICEKHSDLGEIIMKLRQRGTAMAKVMTIAKGDELQESMIIDAFETPLYNTERMQERAISEFRDETYLKCTKLIRSQ